MADFNRVTPRNVLAEKQVLGAILLDPDTMSLVATKLVPDDFYQNIHGSIWEAMLDLYSKGQPIDLVTLSPYMTHEEASGSYLAGLLLTIASSRQIESHVALVKSASRRRKLLKAAQKVIAVAYEQSDADQAASEVKEILMEATGDEESEIILSPARQADILKKYIHSKKVGSPEGILTGYPKLDNMVGGGLHRGDLIVIAARTSVGKSSYAENIAENVAFSGKVVLFASIEMSPEQMMYRYAVRSGQLSRSAVEFGIDNQADEDALEKLGATRAELPFFLMNSPAATTTAIRSAISKLKMIEGRVDLVVIDYLQLLKDRTRQEERLNIGEMTSALKTMAREFEVPIILLSQLNRNIEHRGGEPQLADLRESGRIEEDSDIVILLWKTDKPDALGNVTKLKIAKNRQGPTEPIDIIFHQPTFKFSEK